MSIRRDLLRVVEDALALPKTNLTADAVDNAVKDIEILLRFANPATDKDAMDHATKAIAELRNRLATMPVATPVTPCAYCGCRLMRATNKGRIELSIDASKIGLLAYFIVCSNCGDMRTLVDVSKLPDSFVEIEALG